MFKNTVGRLLGDGICDDGESTRFDFSCSVYGFDHGDCVDEQGKAAIIGYEEAEASVALKKDPKNFDLLRAYVETRSEFRGIVMEEGEFAKLFEEARLNSWNTYRALVTGELLGYFAPETGKEGAIGNGRESVEKMRKKLKEMQGELKEMLDSGISLKVGRGHATRSIKLKDEIGKLKQAIKQRLGHGIQLKHDKRKEIFDVHRREDLEKKEKKTLIGELLKSEKLSTENLIADAEEDAARRRITERGATPYGGLDPKMTLGMSIRHKKPQVVTFSIEENEEVE